MGLYSMPYVGAALPYIESGVTLPQYPGLVSASGSSKKGKSSSSGGSTRLNPMEPGDEQMYLSTVRMLDARMQDLIYEAQTLTQQKYNGVPSAFIKSKDGLNWQRKYAQLKTENDLNERVRVAAEARFKEEEKYRGLESTRANLDDVYVTYVNGTPMSYHYNPDTGLELSNAPGGLTYAQIQTIRGKVPRTYLEHDYPIGGGYAQGLKRQHERGFFNQPEKTEKDAFEKWVFDKIGAVKVQDFTTGRTSVGSTAEAANKALSKLFEGTDIMVDDYTRVRTSNVEKLNKMVSALNAALPASARRDIDTQYFSEVLPYKDNYDAAIQRATDEATEKFDVNQFKKDINSSKYYVPDDALIEKDGMVYFKSNDMYKLSKITDIAMGHGFNEWTKDVHRWRKMEGFGVNSSGLANMDGLTWWDSVLTNTRSAQLEERLTTISATDDITIENRPNALNALSNLIELIPEKDAKRRQELYDIFDIYNNDFTVGMAEIARNRDYGIGDFNSAEKDLVDEINAKISTVLERNLDLFDKIQFSPGDIDLSSSSQLPTPRAGSARYLESIEPSVITFENGKEIRLSNADKERYKLAKTDKEKQDVLKLIAMDHLIQPFLKGASDVKKVRIYDVPYNLTTKEAEEKSMILNQSFSGRDYLAPGTRKAIVFPGRKDLESTAPVIRVNKVYHLEKAGMGIIDRNGMQQSPAKYPHAAEIEILVTKNDLDKIQGVKIVNGEITIDKLYRKHINVDKADIQDEDVQRYLKSYDYTVSNPAPDWMGKKLYRVRLITADKFYETAFIKQEQRYNKYGLGSDSKDYSSPTF